MDNIVEGCSTYRIYGLNIRTSHPLCGIENSVNGASIDLHVQFAAPEENEPTATGQWQPVVVAEKRKKSRIKVERNGDALRIKYNTSIVGNVCSVISEQSDSVWLQFEKGVCAHEKTSFFLGTVLGSILRRRGRLCLHAGSVVINGKAALIVGRQGAGKSTTTAALLRYTDAQLIADDVAVIDYIDNVPHVLPGYAGMRLNPDAITPVLNQNSNDLPLVFSAREKRMVSLSDVSEFSVEITHEPVPVGALFILVDSEGEGVFAEDIPRLSSLLTLVENTYCTYAVIDKWQIEQEFQEIGKLVDTISLRRVRRHRGFDCLPELCGSIADQLGAA